MNHEYFMVQAIQQAKLAEEKNEVPVGAVVVSDGKIIGKGHNLSITAHDPSAHAEMLAIRAAGKELSNYRLVDATLYVTLEPCPMCAGLLVHSRIKTLVFGASDLKTGACGSIMDLTNHALLNHNISVIGGVLGETCSALVSDFFARRRAEKKAFKNRNTEL